MGDKSEGLTASCILDTLSIMKEEATGITARIAARVGAMRTEQGLSLDGLAATSGVSRSMLSLVERGETSPTAVVLEKIAKALGAPLASLFEDAAALVSAVVRSEERTPWRDPESGYVRCNISPPRYPSPIKIVEVKLPAGAKVAYEAGARELGFHQQVWMQDGTIELSSGDATHRLSAGDCLAMRLDAPTTFRNPTRKAARYVVVVATAEGSRRRSRFERRRRT